MTTPPTGNQPSQPAPTPTKGKVGKTLVIAALVLGVSLIILHVLGIRLLPGRTHDPWRLLSCGANCIDIGKAIALYSEANGGLMPPDLKPLIRPELIVRNTLRCPGLMLSSGRECDYFYLPAVPDSDPQTIILCDYKGNHTDGSRNVLDASGAVRISRTKKDFQAELADPCNAAFAKALREAEGP